MEVLMGIGTLVIFIIGFVSGRLSGYRKGAKNALNFADKLYRKKKDSFDSDPVDSETFREVFDLDNRKSTNL